MKNRQQNKEKTELFEGFEQLTINFRLQKFIIDAYCACYNQNRPRRERLQSQHIDYLYELVRMARRQLIYKQKKYSNNPDKLKTDLVKVNSNSEKLGKLRNRSSRTIRNYNRRLIKAGLISKVTHGHELNYDIYFSDFIVFYSYLSDPKKLPKNLENSRALRYLLSLPSWKSLPVYTELLTPSNKELKDEACQNQNEETEIEQNFSDTEDENLFKGIFSVSDLDTMLSQCYRIECSDKCNDTGIADVGISPSPKNSEECNDTPPNSAAPPSNEAKSDISKPDETTQEEIPGTEKMQLKVLKKINQKHIRQQLKSTDINELRLVYAQILYFFALERIPEWKQKVYEGTSGEVIIYIAENYFNDCLTKNALSMKISHYEKAIEMAGRYIRKKLITGKWKAHWTFPETWFDINYQNGFKKALRYYSEWLKKRKSLKRDSQRIEINQKLNDILLEYFGTKEDNYFELLTRVRKTIPTRERQFKACVKYKVTHIENYWSKNQQPKTA